MPEICFADSETRSLADLPVTGAYRYAHHDSTDCLVWGYLFDDEPGAAVWSPQKYWGNTEASARCPDPECPEDLLDHVRSGGYIMFWNAFFDRHIWNSVMVRRYGWPELKLEQVLCAQAQAEANNLPGKLEKACEALRFPRGKDSAGKMLINQLCSGDESTWNSEAFETPEKMGRFRAYCARDVVVMRDVVRSIRPLTTTEWAQYHASERINDRGVMIDVQFASAAQKYAQAEFADLNAELFRLTGDNKLTVTNHVRKARWLHEQIEPYDEELAGIVTRPPKPDGTPRYSADRATREAVLEMLSVPEHGELFPVAQRDLIIQVLECIEAGNSAAVRKFTAMVNQQYRDRVHGQYSFNGAGQTGRFSSRGVQIHNVIRKPLEKGNPDRAIDAICDILNNVPADELAEKYQLPLSRLLARLIRPTFIANDRKMLVWGDYDQIEARVLPWLADNAGGQAKLDIFRSGQDVYKFAAAPIFDMPPDAIEDDSVERQIGKVCELALGFGGGAGAFAAMGRNYGVTLPEHRISDIVQTWRASNTWCVSFWSELWDSAIAAFKHPGVWHQAGRVRYLFHPDLIFGTLICELPCKRWLMYPQFRHEFTECEDKRTGEIRPRWRTTFVRGFGSGFGRVELWHGVLAENVTQATAASVLRQALEKLADVTVLHTHDEIVVEVPERSTKRWNRRLKQVMEEQPTWADGLPLSVSTQYGPYYTK